MGQYAIWDHVPLHRKLEALKYEYEPTTDEPPGVIEKGKSGPCPRVTVEGSTCCPFGVAYFDELGEDVISREPSSGMIVALIEGDSGIFDRDEYVRHYSEAVDFTDAWDAGLVTDLRAAMGLT